MAISDKIWKEYAKSKDPLIKEKIILEYAALVKFVAGRLSIHIGTHVEYDDLVSYGIFGLIDAIDKYDLDKGVKFETYASLRIRGSIIDSIRKMDWVPRSLRQKNKLLDQAYSELSLSLGRDPTENELAKKLDMTIEETEDLIRKSSLSSLVSLEDYMEQNSDAPTMSLNSSTFTDSPESQYEKKELKNILVDAINKLNPQEKKVVALYYFEDLTLKEISKVLGVSESRISQIHSKAMLRMQNRLGKYKAILFSK